MLDNRLIIDCNEESSDFITVCLYINGGERLIVCCRFDHALCYFCCFGSLSQNSETKDIISGIVKLNSHRLNENLLCDVM